MSHEEIQPADLAALDADELAELLEELGLDLAPEQLQAAIALVQQLGGIEAAQQALEQLLPKAA